MATERIIDLENQRFADRPYEGVIIGPDPAERAKAERQELALARLRRRVREPLGGTAFLDRSDLLDLLIVLGLDDW